MLGSGNQADSFDYSDAMSTHSKETKKFTHSAKMDIMELLEEWEEPELQESNEEVSGYVHTKSIVVSFLVSHHIAGGDYGYDSAVSSGP